MTAPLEGIRVLEIASFVAAPAAGTLLFDFGAEVIKLEVPEGEVVRHTRPRMNGFRGATFEGSPQFEMDNRGKRSLTLDLRRPEARDALLRVVDSVDVVLTNVLPARRKKYGFDNDALLARKPSLIVAALSGYGGRGDEADAPAFDYAAFWARTGMMDITRNPDAAPTLQRPGVGDHAAALSLVSGILAALRVRDRDGTGQAIDVSLLGIGLYSLGNDLAQVLATGLPAPMHDREAPRNPLWNHYETSDGRWLLLVMIESPRYWPTFTEAIGHPEWTNEERFRGPVERYRNNRELVALLDGVLGSKSLADWAEIFARHRLIWAPVREMIETLEDPQVQAMGYFRTVDHPELGPFQTMGPPLQMSGYEMPANQPAPALGAHNREVLRAAGLADDEIEKLLPEDPN